MAPELSSQDLADIVSYVEADMTDDERLAFELRVRSNAALDAALVEYMDGDELLWRNGDVVLEGQPSRFSVWKWGTAAAVLIGVGLFAAQLLGGSRDRVAVVASVETLAEYSESAGPLGGQLPPEYVDPSRSAGVSTAEPWPSAREFLEAAEQYESALMAAALRRGQRSVQSNYFVVPLRLGGPRSVLVLGVPERGAPRSYLPPQNQPLALGLRETRLDSGQHCLPRRRVDGSRVGESNPYDYGYVVPSNSGVMHVLVAVRSKELTVELLDAVKGALEAEEGVPAADRVRSLRGLLVEYGFGVTELRVAETD